MYLIFDTETNGLLKDGPVYIREIAWLLLDENFDVINQEEYLIKPDGWGLPSNSFFTNVDLQPNIDKGVSIKYALLKFFIDMQRCKFLIAHNLPFDAEVVTQECKRNGIRGENRPERVCTMELGKSIVPSNHKPRLGELYEYLFKTKFTTLHTASLDAQKCAEIFKHLVVNKLVIFTEETA